MSPAICVFCNYLFAKLFSNPDESFGEVPATDLVCARIDDLKGHVEFLVSKSDTGSEVDEDKIILSEAELIGRKILELSQNHYFQRSQNHEPYEIDHIFLSKSSDLFSF